MNLVNCPMEKKPFLFFIIAYQNNDQKQVPVKSKNKHLTMQLLKMIMLKF